MMESIDSNAMLLLAVVICAIFYHIIVTFVASKVSRKITAKYQSLTYEQKMMWNSRFSSSVSGSVVTCLSFASLCVYEVRNEPLRGGHILVQLHGIAALGYFVSDGLDMIVNYKSAGGTIGLVFHHVTVVTGYSTVLFSGSLGYFLGIRGLCEASQPLLHMRWMLSVLGMKDTKRYIANGLLFAVAFFSLRIVTQYPYYLHVWESSFTPEFQSLPSIVIWVWIPGCMILDILNWYWMALIIKGFVKLLRKKEEKKKIVEIGKRHRRTHIIHG